MERYSNDGPICPHCGHLHRAGDDPEIYYNEDLSELECGMCEKEFRVRAFNSWSWTTEAARSLQGKNDG